ncbi:MAG TPA: 3-oxoadipate enol-lactonase [Candidatus Eisenbacteria bacterium]|jgi:3-oxoadipate enol-lactonase|nr:3-oxoadipate enol-lactonase [Candidatus Eisenbacteria bacterium]
MPFADLKDARIHYQLAGPEHAAVLIFSNSLGADLTMWDAQAAEMAKTFRVLRYDKRGHGQSSAPPGPYSIAHLGRDALALLDFLHFDQVDFCGLSIGGQTGMWLGTNAPERLKKLILSNTAAKIGTNDGWNQRIDTVRKEGMKVVAPAVIERWFTPGFRAKESGTVSKIQRMLESANPEGYAGCCAAVRDFDAREKLGGIRTPTLVIAGTHDPATTAIEGRWIAQQIRESKYAELDAAHLSNIEAREVFTAEIRKFLAA